jgi:hypothetical protein
VLNTPGFLGTGIRVLAVGFGYLENGRKLHVAGPGVQDAGGEETRDF